MDKKIIAIDPGNTQSGYVVVRHDGKKILEVVDRGKVDNVNIIYLLCAYSGAHVAIEMVASYGMAVGAEVFDTCRWIGRFEQVAAEHGQLVALIYRREEKLYLCGQLTAKDGNIIQALVDRFAPGKPNKGKGTKKKPGFFYGFSKDIWQAMAVATTYFDKYVLGIEI
jgi:hypothetical protein